MTFAAQHDRGEAERETLSALQQQYVSNGFTFEIAPAAGKVPAFMAGYRPDAIARKPGSNVAIEVRRRQSRASDLSLREVRRRFDGHPEWQLVVAYAAEDPTRTVSISPSSINDIRDRLASIRSLAVQGERRAAFVMAWSLLEAALHGVDPTTDARPRTPGTVVQTLTMLGYLDAGLERRIRPLIMTRNRIVHGDLTAEPSLDEVELIMDAVEAVLSVS